ncbi:MAG: DUF4003 domain-containing protein [Clostridiales bacterium]|nr:DUF4003 domain-containing protein [Clostridiales bacterium]
MNDKLIERSVLFTSSRDALDGVFTMADSFIKSCCALELAMDGAEVSDEKLRECRNIFRYEIGVFAHLRNIGPLVITRMAASSDPEGELKKINAAYSALRERFRGSDFLCIAAYFLSRAAGEESFAALAAKAREQYDAFKAKHRFRMAEYDHPVCLLLALRGADPAAAAEDADECFRLFREKPAFRCTWALAENLSLCPSAPNEKTEAFRALRGELRAARISTSFTYELASLAMLADRGNELSAAVSAIDGWLSENKKFKGFRIEKDERLMLSFMLAEPSMELMTLALTGHFRKRHERSSSASAAAAMSVPH